MRTLVLWDIDGTLVTTVPHGREAFADAFEAVFGATADANAIAMAGRTDLEIAQELIEQNGIEATEELIEAFERELAASLERRADRMAVDGHAMPGAARAIDAIAAADSAVQSLLTGNIATNARLKLEAFGLGRHIEFDIGAYGSDHPMRPELVAIAVSKARAKHGGEFAPVLVGDTPLDVAAARHGGARAVAVATGPYDVRELADAGADAVLPDLSDTDRALAAILSPR